MNPQKKRPVIIFSPVNGAWYQEIVDERLSPSFLGWARDPEELRQFCAEHDIDFVVFVPERER